MNQFLAKHITHKKANPCRARLRGLLASLANGAYPKARHKRSTSEAPALLLLAMALRMARVCHERDGMHAQSVRQDLAHFLRRGFIQRQENACGIFAQLRRKIGSEIKPTQQPWADVTLKRIWQRNRPRSGRSARAIGQTS